MIFLVPIASIIALVAALLFFMWIMKQDVGNEDIVRISGYIRAGAMAYLRRQYKTVGIFFSVVFVVLLFIAFGLKVLSGYVPFAFITGGLFSGLCGFLGMSASTLTANRTANAARSSLNGALRISFRGGSIMGLIVVGFGLLDTIVWFYALNAWTDLTLNEITSTMLSFGVGASLMALFARVGGGIFTKAADMGADLVGKVEAGIPEDDPRNPAVIADNVGDNVGDIAGLGADLYESFVGSILGTAALAISAFSAYLEAKQFDAVILPMIIASVGTLSSMVGIFVIKAKEDDGQMGLLNAINRGINVASVLTIISSFFVIKAMFPEMLWQLFIPIIAGTLAGVALGYVTDFYTNAAFGSVRKIAEQAKTGHATVITSGLSVGLMSTAPSVLIIILGMIISFGTGGGFTNFSVGLYAIGLASVGMMSTLGINLSIDAFGPIADNAGGIAEMADLPSQTRNRTDALDELGNSTAARGKGLAIGSAALTAITLISAFIENMRMTIIQIYESDSTYLDRFDLIKDISMVTDSTSPELLTYLGGAIMDLRFIIGLFIGGVIITTFTSKTTDAVSLAAGEMIDEVRRQFRTIKGVMTGETPPDYERCVQISTLAAQKKMINPAVTVIFAPIVTGLILGPIAIIGLLLGGLLVGFLFAIFMANSGGAWDNAKKYIERSKSETRDKIAENIKLASRKGLWPFFLTHEYSRFLYELVNLNPLAFSIDVEESEYLDRLIRYINENYLKKGKSLEVLKKHFGKDDFVETIDPELNTYYEDLNKYDKIMFKEFLRLYDEEYGMINDMMDLKESYTQIMNSYAAAVTGDTVGDPLKDTCGPSLDIAIKLATMVSIIFIGFIMKYNLADKLF
ncbi:MAG: sodium-translocating pyrophosphatase [Candidatus Marinimicrobia bacterium]|nr:sodium-translocating pyrophosphatase [Candidatus Neomarinimicrobiota bacterium]